MMQRYFGLVLASALLAACSGGEPTAAPPPSTPAASSAAPPAGADHEAIARAIANTDRWAADRAEDPWRQPATILSFLQARPGMQVIDVFAGSGYYSELLARVAGPTGKVIAYNNPPYARYAGDKPERRYGTRLPNVQNLMAEVTALSLPANSLDAALFVLSYHDVYWRPAEGGWEQTDPVVLLQVLHRALKPGGIVVVQDHAATAGSDPKSVADQLHRIDPARVKQDFTAAGFQFDAQNDAFAHSEDNLSTLVFDPAIRHRTHQFVYRFKKSG